MQILILIGTFVVAGLFAVALRLAGVAETNLVAILCGATSFGLGAGAWFCWALTRDGQLLRRHLAKLQRERTEMIGELELVRTEMQSLLESLNTRHANPAQSEAMLKEMRVLKSLVAQLSNVSLEAAGAQAVGTGALAEAVAVGGGRAVPISDSGMGDPGPGEAEVPQRGPHLSLVGAPVMTGLDPAELLEIVKDGLNFGRVDLYLQPIVELPQRRKRHYECFSRIRNEDGRVILPEHYISVAEEAGIMGTIDNMLLFRCVQLVRKAQRRNQNVSFFSNISLRTLEDQGFFGEFLDFMRDNRNLAGQLIFEMTQDDLEKMRPGTRRNLENLAAMGFRLSMDQVRDLNLDYAGLEELGVRYVKLEADRMRDSLPDDAAVAEMHRFRSRLDRFGMNLIVEKIESEGALKELLDFRLEYGQGYLFGEPRLSREGG